MLQMLVRAILAAVALTAAAYAQTWSETSKVFAPLGALFDNYGWSVSLSGQTLLVGAPDDDLGYPISFCEGLEFDALGGTLLATEATGKQLTRIDLITGIAVPLGTLPAGAEGLAVDSASGAAYTVQPTNEDALYAVDLTSWAVTKVGPLANPLLTSVRGLAFDSSSGTLYGVDAVSDVLAVIDTGTGAGFVVGSLGSPGLVTGLAYDPTTGSLYGSAESTDELLRIDPATGASTPIGPLGYTAVGALAFDPTLGLLYGWNSTGSSNYYNGLLTIDPATGAGTPLMLPGAVGGEGGAYVMDLVSGTTSELRASDAKSNDYFGYDVALDGDTLVVGAYADDDKGSASGSAYVFDRNPSGGWDQVDKLLSYIGQVGDYFGYYLDISGDTLAVAAPRHNAGLLHIFDRDAGGWSLTQAISPTPPTVTWFGVPALDGHRLLVGQPNLGQGVAGQPGRAYVYERTSIGEHFALVAALEASDAEPGNHFGQGVALWGDYAAVGAPGTDCSGTQVDCGCVYVFERDAGGPGAWGQVAKLQDPWVGNYDQIGGALALEGDTLLIGSPQQQIFGVGSGGAVIVYERLAGTWTNTGVIFASDGESDDHFGCAVSLSGNTFGAGAYGGDGYVATSGAAYTFSLFDPTVVYCTAGTSAFGCQATLSASGTSSASAPSGFYLMAATVEGDKDGGFFFGTSGKQAHPWGNGTSYQCVVPPVTRTGLLDGTGTAGLCDGAFIRDLNAFWCATCPYPAKNPGAGATVQAQLWYRDPLSTSNKTISLSDAIEFPVMP